MLVSAPNRVIPLRIPLGFVLLAEAFLLAALFLLALRPEALAIPRHPLGLAVAHLFLLGFGVGVLLGALHQLLPVVLEAPLYRPGWGYPVMPGLPLARQHGGCGAAGPLPASRGGGGGGGDHL